jgi:hypothetical protein
MSKPVLRFTIHDDGRAELQTPGRWSESREDVAFVRELLKALEKHWPTATKDALDDTKLLDKHNDNAALLAAYMDSQGKGEGGRARKHGFEWRRKALDKNQINRLVSKYETDAAFRDRVEERRQMIRELYALIGGQK